MAYIGIDIGTTGICATKISSDGLVSETRNAPNDATLKPSFPGERIQSPERILTIVRELLTGLLKDADGIGISCQMHGILYTDAQGRAVSPLYTWQDGRGALKSKNGNTYAGEANAHPGYGFATHLCNREHSLIPAEAVKLCSIGDYVAMRLCGKDAPLTHITNAASIGAFDVQSNAFTATDTFLPEVTADFSLIGKHHGVPVFAAIGDNQASFLGSVSGHDALVNVGTGAQLSVLSDLPSRSAALETRPFDGKRYLLAGCSLCGGSAFAQVVRFVADCAELMTGLPVGEPYKAVDAALALFSGNALKVDTRFAGTRGDPTVRGSVTGIGETGFTPEALLAGTLDGIAGELYDFYRESGVRADSLVCSGNGIRKNLYLRNSVERVFGVKTRVPVFREEAAFGAALSAMIGSGAIGIREVGKLIRYE